VFTSYDVTITDLQAEDFNRVQTSIDGQHATLKGMRALNLIINTNMFDIAIVGIRKI